MRGRRYISLAPSLLAGIFIEGNSWKVIEGLPADAKFEGAHYDYLRNRFDLMFSSAEWPEAREGDVAMRIEVVCVDLTQQNQDRNGREPSLSQGAKS